MNTWELIKERLASKLSAEAFDNWLARTKLLEQNHDSLTVAVPDDAAKVWIEKEYADEVTWAIHDLNLALRHVSYHVCSNASNGRNISQQGAFQHLSGSDVVFAPTSSHLNPRLTFDNFVVGSCNQFAHAAAKAVATSPRSYNPLFIYGGVGMGKTHLMHAIGHWLLDHYSGMRIVYTSSERFMNEMVNCIKLDRMPQFHAHYRSADVLLIDDVHVLGGKERTQEEFFHTFNELYDHQKQIVISSDSPPKNIAGLVERLRSRFEWGLMVDVQPPDLETKMAILDKKAEADGVKLPEDVRVFIATKTKSNVRELEGALIKLLAYSEVTGSPITLAMAQQILKHLGPAHERKVTIDAVTRAVAEKYHLQPSQLKQKSNTRQIAYPRQVAMYLIKEITPASLPEIGRAFGGKHHTTVLHSIHKIEKLRCQDAELNKMIHNLIDSLQSSS